MGAHNIARGLKWEQGGWAPPSPLTLTTECAGYIAQSGRSLRSLNRSKLENACKWSIARWSDISREQYIIDGRHNRPLLENSRPLSNNSRHEIYYVSCADFVLVALVCERIRSMTISYVRSLNSQGTPSPGAQNTRVREKFATFDWNGRWSRKRYEIGPWLLWNVNRKS